MKKNFRSFGVAQALALGLCTGLLLSSFSCGTKPPITRCSHSTCDGCCDATGSCFAPNDAGVQSPAACGLEGITCAECATGELCVTGQCKRGTGGGSGGSTGGGSGGSSGGSGGSTGGGTGGAGCSAASCAAGCCNTAGTCVPSAMQNFSRCGTGGAACAVCPMGQACLANDGGMGNVCQVPNCSACFDTSGNCRTDKMTATDPGFCGVTGGVCARCDTANGQTCQGGRCTSMMAGCNSGNCDGCCAGNTCIGFADAGLSNAQCGRNAATCVTCNTPQTCDTQTGNCTGGGAGGGAGGAGGAGGGGILPPLDGGVCDAMSCAAGCCLDPLGCFANDTSVGLGVVCGTGGVVCKVCLFAPDCATGMSIPGLCM